MGFYMDIIFDFERVKIIKKIQVFPIVLIDTASENYYICSVQWIQISGLW